MVYLESPSTDPAFNLALEQYVFDCLPRENEYFMLWQNDNAIIVGKHQNTAAEVNAAFVKERGIQVVRRLSGGGAVYHDLGNLNFTFIVNAGDVSALDLKLFCRPVANALRRLGVPAEVNGRNDITIDGGKFSGNAQYIKGGRLMHHGTILFDSDLSVLAGALRVQVDKLVSKGIPSVRSRVTTVRPYLKGEVGLGAFKALLLDAIFEGTPMTRYDLTPADLASVEALVAQRYGNWEWNWGSSPSSSVHKRRRVEGCGSVEVFLDTDKGRITALDFRGDFFSTEDPEGLTPRLIGQPLEEGALRAALKGVDVARYFTNLSTDDFLWLLLN